MDPVQLDKNKLKKIRIFLKTHCYLAPINFREEERKFFKDKKYNPQFHYPNVAISALKQFESDIEDFQNPKFYDWEAWIYKRKIEETKLKLQLLLAIGTSSVTHLSTLLYQLKFDAKTLESAKKDALIPASFKKSKSVERYEIAKIINTYLEKYQIKDWKIILSSRYDFSFQILPKSKLIKVGRCINSNALDLEYLLAHEIDGHVIRAENASKQKNKLYRNIFPFYIKTEEGLACYLGDYFSRSGETTIRNHAVSYLAAYFAKTHTFSETYKFLYEAGFSCELAFQKTFRLKRGIGNTEAPGVFAREAIYYEGMQEVKNYLETDGDIRKLYAGKVSLADANIIPVPKNQIIPERVATLTN